METMYYLISPLSLYISKSLSQHAPKGYVETWAGKKLRGGVTIQRMCTCSIFHVMTGSPQVREQE